MLKHACTKYEVYRSIERVCGEVFEEFKVHHVALLFFYGNPHLRAAHCHPAETLAGQPQTRPVEPPVCLRNQLIRGRHPQDVRGFLYKRTHLGEEKTGMARDGGMRPATLRSVRQGGAILDARVLRHHRFEGKANNANDGLRRSNEKDGRTTLL